MKKLIIVLSALFAAALLSSCGEDMPSTTDKAVTTRPPVTDTNPTTGTDAVPLPDTVNDSGILSDGLTDDMTDGIIDELTDPSTLTA